MLANLDEPCAEEATFLSRHDLRDVRLYASSVVEWLNCLDVCEARIVLDAKRDQRFQM